MKRQISNTMKNALLEGGVLNPLLVAVQNDDTLDLELRGNTVNIYYRGGSLFRITEKYSKDSSSYEIFFDINYCKHGAKPLKAKPTCDDAVEELPHYKQAMDLWFHENPKYEREFQQLIVRENNSHGKISNATDYFITDIEYADGNSRFDMVAFKWLSKGSERKNNTKPSLALIEVKYGDGALDGNAGIKKHLEDFKTFLGDKDKVKALCNDMSEVFKQKCQLGLVDHLKDHQYDVKISPENPEVIFIFANHDPDSNRLREILSKINLPNKFSIKIAKSSNMGYGLYVDCLEDIKIYRVAGKNKK